MRRFDALRADEPPVLLELDFETLDDADDLARGMVGDGSGAVLWCYADMGAENGSGFN